MLVNEYILTLIDLTMNGIIALCHFCESHGPRVMFCTQAVHSSEPQVAGIHMGSHLPGTTRYPELSEEITSLADEITGSVEEYSTVRLSTVDGDHELCVACRSLDDGQSGFISHDTEAGVHYISTQHPCLPEILSMVEQACIRSLSCEVCPNKEGAIFFGDSSRGHVISYTFSLQNCYARGSTSVYSAMIVMMDKVYLLNMWPFLVDQLKEAIISLKKQADIVYSLEPLHMSDSAPNLLKFQRDQIPILRSLKDITGADTIFEQIHTRFTWILKAGGNRLTESLLEGPPTEDSIIDLEKQEMTEEGFVKLYTKNDNPEMEFKRVSLQNAEGGALHPDSTLSPVTDDLSPVARREFVNLRHLLHILGIDKFKVLSHHVLIGNQVIIRSGHRRLVVSAVNSLQKLLPLGCCRAVHFSDHYENSYKCNILGIPQGVLIPQSATHYVVMDIIEPESAIEAREDERSTLNNDAKRQPSSPISVLPVIQMDTFCGYIFILTTPELLPNICPTVLDRMLVALSDFNLADSVVEQCMVSVKEEWMNKVKLLFKFTKSGGRRVEDDTKQLLTVIGAQNKDNPLLEFWKSGLSLQYRNHLFSSGNTTN